MLQNILCNRSPCPPLENSRAALDQLALRQLHIQADQIGGRQAGKLLRGIQKLLRFLWRDNSLGEFLKFMDVVGARERFFAKRVRIGHGQLIFQSRSIFKEYLDAPTEGFSGWI